MPIIVHDHMVGALMTGQLLLEGDPQPRPETLIEKNPLLSPFKPDLHRALDSIKTRHLLSHSEYTTLGVLLSANAKRISQAADANYGNLRARYETAFRHELTVLCRADALQVLPHMLRRMLDFWRFKAISVLHWRRSVGSLSLLAHCAVGGGVSSHEAGEVPLAIITEPFVDEHATPYLWDCHSADVPDNRWIRVLVGHLHRLSFRGSLAQPSCRFHYLVVFPYPSQLLVIVFSGRAPAPAVASGNVPETPISERLQESILHTSAEVFRTVHDTLSLQGQVELALHDVMYYHAHKINGQISTALLRLAHSSDAAIVASPEIAYCCQVLNNIQLGQKAAMEAFRIRIAELKPIYLEDLAAQLRVHWQLQLEQGLMQLGTATGGMVYWDAALIERAIRELLFNALEHARSGTVVQLTIRGGRSADYVEIEVLNQGVGVSNEIKAHIFLPFVSLRSTGEGHGIGLAVVRRVCVLHGGIAIECGTPGQSACFVMRIPRDPVRQTLSCE